MLKYLENPGNQTIVFDKPGENQLVIMVNDLKEPVKLDINLKSSASKLELLGLILGKEQDNFDLSLTVSHDRPETKSEILFKSLLKEASQQKFKGTVKIAKGAEKAESFLSHRTMLLSEEARSRSLPLMEISEEAVNRAGHASTTSKIDDDQLFYLESRGLTQAASRQLIINGFVEDLLTRIKSSVAKQKIKTYLSENYEI